MQRSAERDALAERGPSHPAVSAGDVDYLLEQANRVLAQSLRVEDVEGVYAGLRPLLAGESDQTSALPRKHTVAHSVPGLVVVAGGKYTPHRIMAKDVVDEAVRVLPRRRADPAAPGPRSSAGTAEWRRRPSSRH